MRTYKTNDGSDLDRETSETHLNDTYSKMADPADEDELDSCAGKEKA